MLIGLGIWALIKAKRLVIHTHKHEHDGSIHQHVHMHPHGTHDNEANNETDQHEHSHASLWIGTLHGTAGSGHLFAAVPAMTLSTTEAIIYLAAYFIAAILSMTVFAALLGLLAQGRKPGHLRGLMYSSSVAAIGIGVFWIGNTWPL